MVQTQQDSAKDASWNNADLSRPGYAAGMQHFDALATAIRDEVLSGLIRSTTPPKSVVEIGSGLGRAFGHSKFNARIVQTDPVAEVVQGRKQKGEAVQLADAKTLGTQFKNLEMVLANNVLDTMVKAEMVANLEGIRAALKPRGKLVHFMDLNAYHKPLCSDFLNAGMLPFPYLKDNVPCLLPISRELVNREFANVAANLSALDRQQVEWFLEDPLGKARAVLDPKYGGYLLGMLAGAVQRMVQALHISVEAKDMSDLFVESFLQTLPGTGFKVVQNGYRRKDRDLPVVANQQVPHLNHMTSSHGIMRQARNPAVPERHVRVSVDMHVLILERT